MEQSNKNYIHVIFDSYENFLAKILSVLITRLLAGIFLKLVMEQSNKNYIHVIFDSYENFRSENSLFAYHPHPCGHYLTN